MASDSFAKWAAGGLLLLAYLLGSIPWGLWLARRFGPGDIRRQGSGNIGATNVARLAGPGLGLATLAGDVLKGWLPVKLASALGIPAADSALYLTALGLMAVLGHLFPLYTGGRGGGKGVATTAGAFGALAPAAVAVSLALFVCLFAWTRRASAGSLAAAAVLPAAAYLTTHNLPVSAGALLAASLIFVRHAANIRRLMEGREPPFSFGSKPAAGSGREPPEDR